MSIYSGDAGQLTLVAQSDEVPEGGRYLLTVDDLTVGLFRVDGVVYAYENTCPHQGGPVCQGRLINGVRERLDHQQRSLGLDFDAAKPHIVCPWHGTEFELKTGRHPGLPGNELRSFKVEEADGEIRIAI